MDQINKIKQAVGAMQCLSWIVGILNKGFENTPAGCKEIEKADGGAHGICERIAPFMSKRLSIGSAPTVRIWNAKIYNDNEMATITVTQTHHGHYKNI
jgi:hypothetical protein